MPYRRLPNTDSARLKALETLMKCSQSVSMFELACTQATIQKVRYFLPVFKQALVLYEQSYHQQVKSSRDYNEIMKKARLYISHFIQVLNMAIARGELKTEVRTYYQLKADEKNVPRLSTEKEIITWGENIIKGEAARLLKGGHPMTNPTIAVVKVRYEEFIRLYRTQKQLQENSTRALNRIAELRNEADTIILNAWNEVEDKFKDLEPELKRENAKSYGLIYVYRRNENLNFKNVNYQVVR